MFYFMLNIGRSDLRMFAWNVLQTCHPLELPAVASFRKQMKKKLCSYGNKRLNHFCLSRACGRWGHVFATSANPRSLKKMWSCHPLLLFMRVSMITNTWFQFWIGVCLPHPPDSTKEICYGDLVTDLVTEILWRRSCYGDSVTETPTHFNPYRFRQTLSTTHRRFMRCKGYLNTHQT